MQRVALACALGGGAAFASAFTFNGSNWLVNGDAEATATGNTNKTINPSFGWTVGGWLNNGCTNSTVEVRDYTTIWDMATDQGVDGWGYAGPSEATRGNNMFIGGGPVTGNSNRWWITGLYQDEWIYGNNDAISKIDKGNVTYDFSGWFGGVTSAAWTGTGAWANAQAHFTGNGVDQWVTIGGTNFRAHNGSGGYWSYLGYSDASGIIPVGTRRIEIFLHLGHDSDGWGNDANYTYGAADNISFKVGQPVPEPMTLAALGLGVAGLLARRRRKA